MKDYSQNGEQKIILEYFGGKIGSVLSVGENDGETFSMSRALMILGWRGALVEPSPAAYHKLCLLYGVPFDGLLSEVKIGNATLVRAAITTKNGSLDFYDSGTHLKKGDVALLSTTRPEEMVRWKKSGEQFTKTTVRGVNFPTLMKETGVTKFDFVSIDAEGADVPILQQINLTDVGCQLLCIECNQRKEDELAVDAHCRMHGMKPLARSYENLLYARL